MSAMIFADVPRCHFRALLIFAAAVAIISLLLMLLMLFAIAGRARRHIDAATCPPDDAAAVVASATPLPCCQMLPLRCLLQALLPHAAIEMPLPLI